MLIVAVLLVTVLMRIALIGAVVYLLLPKGSRCPNCQVEMVAIRSRMLQRFLPVIQRRWCLECGWSGLVRRGDAAPQRQSRVINRAPRS